MTKNQCRAARALLEWTQTDLAGHSLVSLRSIKDFETGATEPRRSTLEGLKRAFAEQGILFLDQSGVDLKQGKQTK